MTVAARAAAAIAAVTVILATDIGSKRWAADELRRTGARPVAGGHAVLRYAENRGIAFGLFRQTPAEIRQPLLVGYATAVAVVVAGLLTLRLGRSRPAGRLVPVGLCTILAGTLGNLHDRVERGYVVDFIDYSAKGRIDWPVFNVADISIAVGMALCLAAILRGAFFSGAAET